MGFLDFLKAWFGTKEEPKKNSEPKIKNDMKRKPKDDKSFHPEILFLINRPYAEYVEFEEI